MTAPAPPLKVFLCHASEDKPIVRELFERLKADGFDPWLDSDALLPGMDWDLEIQKAMRASEAVIVCFSSVSVSKEGYVQKEIKYAQEIQKEKPEGTIFFIPLQLEACEMPFRLRGVQWGHYYEPDGYEKLVRALNQRAEQVRPHPAFSTHLPPREGTGVRGTHPPKGDPLTGTGGAAVRATLVSGAEAVSVGGDVNDTLIVTGDNNVISLTRQGAFAFQLLSEDFRRRQADAHPAPFYDGAVPNWANIARGDDAQRLLFQPVYEFARRQEFPYKSAVILGAAGEGKTTLLRRLAWQLAEDGAPVFVRHFEHLVPSVRVSLDAEKPLVLVFDEADQEEELPRLAAELADNGIPFVLLLASRLHEWQEAALEGSLKRSGTFRKFALDRLDEKEVDNLLERLERAGKLDALQALPREQRIAHFLDRLQADGQLLPALLTARYGVEQFEAILLDVFEKLRRRPGSDFLFTGYAALASVHRYGLWLSRSLLAGTLGIPAAEIGPRLLGPLTGELIEVQENGAERLSTRHPVIAEHAMRLLEARRWAPEAVYLYEQIFAALGGQLERNPHDPQKKLLTILPLRFVRQNRIEEARRLFAQGTRADPTHAPTWQAWALMEQKLGNIEEARRLFAQGTRADPKNAPTWQAWALMEQKLGNITEARRLFEQGTRADPTDAATWQAWALMEQKLGNIAEARRLFEQGTRAGPTHAPTWEAWALMELFRNPAAALEVIERGLKKVLASRECARLLCTRGSALSKLKRFPEAEKAFQEALELDAKNPYAHYYYALQALEAQRKFPAARQHYQRAQQLNPPPSLRAKIQSALKRLPPL